MRLDPRFECGSECLMNAFERSYGQPKSKRLELFLEESFLLTPLVLCPLVFLYEVVFLDFHGQNDFLLACTFCVVFCPPKSRTVISFLESLCVAAEFRDLTCIWSLARVRCTRFRSLSATFLRFRAANATIKFTEIC